jgi:prevent-host-death family protein
MSRPPSQDVHGRRVAAFSASTAKNTFGTLLDTALADGIVAITKHERVKAVVLSVEEYERMLSRQSDPLRQLHGEFDALVAKMQTSTARAAGAKLFKATPAALGAAAVKQAKKRG